MKIDLNVKSKNLFGRYLPNVFVNKISVGRERTDSGTAMEDGSYEFLCNLTINMTKDDLEKDPQEFIRNNFDDLYLYGWISPFSTLNTQLEESKLNLQDLIYTFEVDAARNFDSTSIAFPFVLEYMITLFVKDVYGVYYGIDDAYEVLTESERVDAILTPYDQHNLGSNEMNVHLAFWGKTHVVDEDDESVPSNTFGPWYGLTASMSCFMTQHIYDVLLYLTDYGESGILGPSSDDDPSILKWKVPLTDLLGTESGPSRPTFVGTTRVVPTKVDTVSWPSSYGSSVVESESYDIDGKEIIQIQNIELLFKLRYNPAAGADETIYQLGVVEKLFAIFTIGLDWEELDTTRRSFFNNNFGDITYEHVLKYNDIPEQVEEIFVEAETLTPYHDIPLQTFEGRYFVSEPVDHRHVIDTINSLIEQHRPIAGTDPELEKNIENLEYILEAKKDSHSLIPTLGIYRRTYGPKSSITKSGTFYNAFSPLLNVINGRVGIQTRLIKKLIYTSKIYDSRVFGPDEEYTPNNPNPPYKFGDDTDATWDPSEIVESVDVLAAAITAVIGEAEGDSSGLYTTQVSVIGNMMTGDPGGAAGYTPHGRDSDRGRPTTSSPFYLRGNEYIPRAWTKMARSVVMTTPVGPGMGDYSEFLAEEEQSPDASSGLSLHSMALSDETYDAYRQGVSESGVPMEGYEGHTTEEADLRADFVVQNKGIVFFDWEKALHTQSNLAYIASISRIQQIFNLTVPYKYFKVSKATMVRTTYFANYPPTEEDAFVPQVWSGATWLPATPNPIIITSNMDLDIDYPLTKTCTYEYDPNNLKYGQPYVYQYEPGLADTADLSEWASGIWYNSWYSGDTQTKLVSYLKFVNFDVACDDDVNDAWNTRLRNYNPYYQSLFGTGEYTAYDTATGAYTESDPSGLSVKGSYRLMCFEYRDFMDDDVAYYNTYGAPESEHSDLERLSITGEPMTEYIIGFEVEDRTLEFFYDKLFQDLVDAYDSFVETYYEAALEACSYNNLGDYFNTFFADAVFDPDDRTLKHACARAVVYYNMFRELLYQTFSLVTTGEVEMLATLQTETKRILLAIMPPDGTLGGMEEFKLELEKLINLISPTYHTDGVPITTHSGHSVFERAIELTGRTVSDIYDETETSYAGSFDVALGYIKDHVHTMRFFNTIPIDEYISGNMRLSAVDESDIVYSTGFEATGMTEKMDPLEGAALIDKGTTQPDDLGSLAQSRAQRTFMEQLTSGRLDVGDTQAMKAAMVEKETTAASLETEIAVKVTEYVGRTRYADAVRISSGAPQQVQEHPKSTQAGKHSIEVGTPSDARAQDSAATRVARRSKSFQGGGGSSKA